MRVLRTILLAGLLLALPACVSATPGSSPVAGEQMVHQGTLAQEGEANRSLVTIRQAPPGSDPIAEPSPAPRLGTRWGESIISSIRFVSLSRLWPDRPDGRVTIRYDGARASGLPAGMKHPLPVAYGTVEWAVLDDDGDPMQAVPEAGGGFRLHGRSGDRYRLAFSNRGRQTVEIVATVDGLDVLSGRPGSIAGRGYVVRPHEMLVIEGFRRSESEVAAFRFSTPDQAYAANTPQGDPRNIGVIGMAVFTLDDPANVVEAAGPQPFPADQPRDTRFAPPPAS